MTICVADYTSGKANFATVYPLSYRCNPTNVWSNN